MATAPTSITFSKVALIDAAEAALKAHAKADTEYQAAVAKYRRDNSPPSQLPKVVALRDALSKFIKSGRTPTAADVKVFREAAGTSDIGNLYDRQVDDYQVRNNVSKPAGWLSNKRRTSWAGLIKMLQAHTGDTVTANQLKLFGYTHLEPLFRAAATLADGAE